jgi:hypothetical protein
MEFPRVIDLKRKLMTEKDLHSIWVFFLDHLGENVQFLDSCQKTQDEFVEGLVEQVASQLFPGNGEITGLWLKRLPDHSMIHGAFFAGARISAVFYFEDVQAGMIAFCGLRRGEESKFIRFSGKPLAKEPDVSRN